ncbi:MAG: 2,3-bisphosphoglycerate-independent phosphoglycerate mutase [Candidatus Thermoplasmatota archaeon]|nr:2,3-bisphosphoglycerate-independent phosphoglycerate mutase [Candidatus Thermoplasmatota archaeon]
MDLDFIKKLVKSNSTKIVMLVMDGVGGLPQKIGGLTELETAHTPNLDLLASKSICGLQTPVGSGITPGSGPGHLGIFGYNPAKYQVGRGTLAALGIGFDLRPEDVAARGNFCTIDENGNVLDRRAGRIPTEKNQELCNILREIKIPGVEVFVETVKEHRCLLVLRGDGLSGNLIDTDPQMIGKQPLQPKSLSPDGQKTVDLVNQFLEQAKNVLADQHPANMILLRGFSKKPNWPTFEDSFGLKSAAIAAYPMYRGLAKLLGMSILETGTTIQDEFTTLEKNWDDYDFFYLHVKKTDSYGEDGDFDKKVSIIEETDREIPRLLNLNPDVIMVTGDHSTPALMKAHSWHPVPVLLYSKYCRADRVEKFGERNCITGGLGPRFPAEDLMPLALANAKRLGKFGA